MSIDWVGLLKHCFARRCNREDQKEFGFYPLNSADEAISVRDPQIRTGPEPDQNRPWTKRKSIKYRTDSRSVDPWFKFLSQKWPIAGHEILSIGWIPGKGIAWFFSPVIFWDRSKVDGPVKFSEFNHIIEQSKCDAYEFKTDFKSSLI